MKDSLNGVLITNSSLQGPKFDALSARLLDAAKDENVGLSHHYNTEFPCMFSYNFSTFDFVLFWDKDVHLAQSFENMGLRCFNSCEAIEICDDKAKTYLRLQNTDIKMPRTVISPLLFNGMDLTESYYAQKFIDKAVKAIDFPIIIKECKGSFGQQVYLVQDMNSLIECIRSLRDVPFIMQEFISTSRGVDVRIEVVGNEVVAAMERTNPDNFRSNISLGGIMKPYTPTRAQARMALDVTRRLGLDFCGIDILFGLDGEPVLCEVNSNAHIVNISDCTNIDVAARLFSYIKKELAE